MNKLVTLIRPQNLESNLEDTRDSTIGVPTLVGSDYHVEAAKIVVGVALVL
jgi:hypothetical protein